MKKQNLLDCLLSILDSLKLYDTGSLQLGDETLSQMMFRKMEAYGIDLNKELGFTHLKPVTKNIMTVKEIQEKYRNIEDKIPSVWPDYEKAGIELSQDILYHWNIQEGELIRVIALIEMRVPGLSISQHIDPSFAFCGLYPERMRKFDFDPNSNISDSISNLLKSRKEYKELLDDAGSISELLQREISRLKEELDKLNKNINL